MPDDPKTQNTQTVAEMEYDAERWARVGARQGTDPKKATPTTEPPRSRLAAEEHRRNRRREAGDRGLTALVDADPAPQRHATIGAILATSSLAMRRPRNSRANEATMTKPITLTNRLVDAVVTAAMAFSLVVHAQFMILPPHFV